MWKVYMVKIPDQHDHFKNGRVMWENHMAMHLSTIALGLKSMLIYHMADWNVLCIFNLLSV